MDHKVLTQKYPRVLSYLMLLEEGGVVREVPDQDTLVDADQVVPQAQARGGGVHPLLMWWQAPPPLAPEPRVTIRYVEMVEGRVLILVGILRVCMMVAVEEA